MLTLHYDERTGIIRRTAQGLASPAEFDAHLRNLEPMLARSRARHGKALHLIDAGASPVQVKESFDHMAGKIQDTVAQQDCSAIVMQSALARMQAKRLTGHQHFCSTTEEAERWLLDQVSGDSKGAQNAGV
ncbi:hypothetical protein LWE61_16735 [Sphingobium sufflavum]|uniref:hypothetical protein n=1 Tax=Sphingobium sufflavum TaxID=1129547 RepID=UPI001F203465|nr:hypothetical protein [Sphingobium sufflavum]MCE7798188.1 hypothetical protein [Sphingobium sufflavum]